MIPDFYVTRENDGRIKIEIKNISGFSFYLHESRLDEVGDPEEAVLRPVISSISGGDGSLSVFWQYVPTAPVITLISPVNNGLRVAFTAPTNVGNLPITDYEVQIDNGEWLSSGRTVTPITLTGLVNGTEYAVRIRAVNAIGTLFQSNQLSQTPAITTLWMIHTGVWDDAGEWDDTEFWIDNP